jgi:hypothetical protein
VICAALFGLLKTPLSLLLEHKAERIIIGSTSFMLKFRKIPMTKKSLLASRGLYLIISNCHKDPDPQSNDSETNKYLF